MGNITKISIDNVKHDIKDSVARSDIAYIKKELLEYQIDYSKQYLTIVSLEDNNTISWKSTNLNNLSRKISVSTNNGLTWTDKYAITAGAPLATLNKGDKLLVKGTNANYANALGYYTCFTSTKKFNVEGNIMSLIYGDNFVGQTVLDSIGHNFENLFNNCTKLTSVENLILPATIIVDSCYSYMFRSCTSLTTAPKLPATTLATSCYHHMFYNCTSLTTAPELPAIRLTSYCYTSMFSGCSSLTTTPELPATTLANNCYSSMFYSCTSLTIAPELPATTLAGHCYTDMFSGCSSLTTAPELPATTLAEYCYTDMFYSCTSLNYVKCLATNIPANNCTTNWLLNVASTGIFIKADNMTSWTTGTNGIPSGWTVYTESEYKEVKYYELNNSIDSINDSIDSINDSIDSIDINLSLSASKTHEKINGKNIKKILIPIDSTKNVYNNDSLSNTTIIPYISNDENYLLLQLGNIIEENSIILEANLTGNGFYCTPNILYNEGNMKIYSPLPLSLIKDNLQYLIITYYNFINTTNNNKYLYLWIDDYPDNKIEEIIDSAGANNWDDYVENYLLVSNNTGGLYGGATGYQYTNETFEWNNQEYYLWKGFNNIGDKAKYILTETINYTELYNHSLEADSSNTWCPYIIKFNPDYLLKDETDFYDETTGDILVKVSNNPQDTWIKYLSVTNTDYVDWDDYVENYLLVSNSWIGQGEEYSYTGETFEWKGVEYYLWVENSADLYYILTDTIDYQTLYDKSIEANHYNMNCPYVAKLDEDKEFYDLPNLDKWLVKVVADSNDNTLAQYIYIDDFNIGNK